MRGRWSHLQPRPAPGLDPDELESLVRDETKNPEEVIESIVSSAAPAPQTTEEKHWELEDKIVRECVREYTRGGIYFAYSFGAYPPAYGLQADSAHKGGAQT